MGRSDAVDLARVGESEQVAAGMRLVRGAARRATGLPAGALLTAGPGRSSCAPGSSGSPRTPPRSASGSAASPGCRPSVDAERGRAGARNARSRARAGARVRVPIAALRGRRVSLTVASADAAGLQLAYVGTVQRAPALRVVRFVPPRRGCAAARPDRRRRDRLARARRRARRRSSSARARPGSASARAGSRSRARASMLKVELPRRAVGARRLHGQRGGGGRRLARAHPPGVIAHLDLDAFFAAVEQLDRPELRGQARRRRRRSPQPRRRLDGQLRGAAVRHPLGHERGRGLPALSAARSSSRRTWRATASARAPCGRSSASLVERFEQVGIDEGYLDLTGLVREPSDARALLGALQAAVRDATGLSCSLGCGTGKTVAKIASDHRKPGGMFVVAPGPRGGVPGAAAAARAPRHRAARRAAAAGGGPRRRSATSPARTTTRSRRSAWARSGATCASAPAASIRAPSSSRPPIPSRSARRRRSTTTSSTRSRWPPSSRRSPRTCSRASSGTGSRRAP